MSLVIKGMEMPEKCGLCDIFHAESPMHCPVVKGHKTVGAPYGMPRPEWCPLREEPENTINADELKERIRKALGIKSFACLLESERKIVEQIDQMLAEKRRNK